MVIMNCFCGIVDRRKPYFQPGPLSEILTISNLRHAASRIWTCAEPELRLWWMKLCSSDNHYTTAPQGSAVKEGIDFEIGHIGASAKLYRELKETSWRTCLLFGGKKNKTLLTYTFIRWLLNLFDLPRYNLELRKRSIPRLLLMCLEVIEEGCSLGILGGKGSRKSWLLVKLYTRRFESEI